MTTDDSENKCAICRNSLEHKHNTQFIFTVIIHKSFIKDFLILM